MTTNILKYSLRAVIVGLLWLLPAQVMAGVEGVVRYGVSPSSLQYDFFEQDNNNHQSYAEMNYRPVRLTGYVDGNDVRYFTQWIPNNGVSWRSGFGKTAAQFDSLNNNYRTQGFYLIDVSGYQTPNGVRYAGIWYENTKGVYWSTYRDSTVNEMQNLADTIGQGGWHPQRIEGYAVESQSRFVSIWYYQQGGNYKWHSRLTAGQYQLKFDAYKAMGYKIFRVHSHTAGGKVYFSGIWMPTNQAAWVRTNRGADIFQRYYNNYWATGYNIDDFYAAATPNGVRFGGIWFYDGLPDDSTLYQRVRKQVDGATALGGAAVLNLTTGEEFSIHGDRTFAIASTSKIGILYALLKETEEGNGIAWMTVVNSGSQLGCNQGPDSDDECQGGWLQENTDYVVAQLAGYMIRSSNNWATNLLIQLVGLDKINQHLDGLGLQVTRMNRYMSGPGSPSSYGLASADADRAAGYENLSTPREMIELLRIVQQDNVLNDDNEQRFWDTLKMDGDDDGSNMKNYFAAQVTPMFNPAVDVVNKPGSLGEAGSDSRHVKADAGRFVFPDGQIVLIAVFMDHISDDPDNTVTASQSAIDQAVDGIYNTAWEVAKQYYH